MVPPAEGKAAGSVAHAETGRTSPGECIGVDCNLTDTRLYLNGPACDAHSPWANAGRPDPRTQIDPTRTDSAMRVSSAGPWAKGGTDIDKEKPGGYMSPQRALKLAAERDAASTLQRQGADQ